MVRIRAPKFQINQGEWPVVADHFNRKEEIENLTPILLNAEAPLVFAIDAQWGKGKTTFIELWSHYLSLEIEGQEKQPYQSVTINAWSSDFAEDPLLPMLASINEWVVRQKTEEDPVIAKVDAFTQKVKALVPKLLRTGLNTGVKIATVGAVDVDALAERFLAEGAGQIAGDAIEHFQSKQAALETFKDVLQEALELLPEYQQNLIIFIDELDRCRPTYAIELLERVKHLFDVERLVFVLSLNEEQLAKGLQGVYGAEFNGKHYLKRFIDMDYQLRTPDLDRYVRVRFFTDEVEQHFNQSSQLHDVGGLLVSVVTWVCDRFDLSLRDVDQLATRCGLVARSISRDSVSSLLMIVTLLILRRENGDLYGKYVDDPESVNEVLLFLFGDLAKENKIPDDIYRIAGVLVGGVNTRRGHHHQTSNPVTEHWESERQSHDHDSLMYEKIGELIRLSQFQHGQSPKMAAERIEFVHKINL